MYQLLVGNLRDGISNSQIQYKHTDFVVSLLDEIAARGVQIPSVFAVSALSDLQRTCWIDTSDKEVLTERIVSLTEGGAANLLRELIVLPSLEISLSMHLASFPGLLLLTADGKKGVAEAVIHRLKAERNTKTLVDMLERLEALKLPPLPMDEPTNLVIHILHKGMKEVAKTVVALNAINYPQVKDAPASCLVWELAKNVQKGGIHQLPKILELLSRTQGFSEQRLRAAFPQVDEAKIISGVQKSVESSTRESKILLSLNGWSGEFQIEQLPNALKYEQHFNHTRPLLELGRMAGVFGGTLNEAYAKVVPRKARRHYDLTLESVAHRLRDTVAEKFTPKDWFEGYVHACIFRSALTAKLTREERFNDSAFFDLPAIHDLNRALAVVNRNLHTTEAQAKFLTRHVDLLWLSLLQIRGIDDLAPKGLDWADVEPVGRGALEERFWRGLLTKSGDENHSIVDWISEGMAIGSKVKVDSLKFQRIPAFLIGGDGNSLVRITTNSGDFVKFREYQQGDELKHVDHRASARTDKILVRTYEDTPRAATHLYVDLHGYLDGDYEGKLQKLIARMQYAEVTKQRLVTHLLFRGQIKEFDSANRNDSLTRSSNRSALVRIFSRLYSVATAERQYNYRTTGESENIFGSTPPNVEAGSAVILEMSKKNRPAVATVISRLKKKNAAVFLLTIK